MGELGLRGVDASDEDVEHEVHALDVGEAVAIGLRGQQGRDQVLAGIVAARGQQRLGVVVELDHCLLDELALGHERLGVELLLDPVGPVVQPRRIGERGAHHRRDDERGVGLREGVDELAGAVAAHRLPQLRQVGAHGRAPAVGGARREGRVDEVAQAPVVVAVDAEDVAAQLLGERAGLDPEELRELAPGEGRRTAAQEDLARLAVEHHRADRRGRQPALGAELRHPRMKARTAQGRIGVVEDREVELGQQRHGGEPIAWTWFAGAVAGHTGGHGPRRSRPAARQPPVPGHDADGRAHAARRGASDARRLRGGRPQLPRHRRRLRRRRLRADARAVARAPARRGRRGHQGPLRRLRSRRGGSRARADRAGVRRLAAAAGDRRHRPLPGPRARPRRRSWRTRWRRSTASCAPARCARSAPRTSPRGCWRGRSASRTAKASPPSSRCSRSTRWSSARSRRRSCPSAAPPGSGCSRGARSGPAS